MQIEVNEFLSLRETMQQMVHQPFMKPAIWAHPFALLVQRPSTSSMNCQFISKEVSPTLSTQPTSSFRLLSSSLGKVAGRIHSAERAMGEKHSLTALQNHHPLIFPDVEQMLVTKTNLSISGERLIQWRQKGSGRTAPAQYV